MVEKENFPHGIVLTDWGIRERLDGAKMQFMVTIERDGHLGSCLGYFATKEDAELFAESKAGAITGKMMRDGTWRDPV